MAEKPITPAVWGPRRRKRSKGRRSSPWYVRVMFPDGSREFKTFSRNEDDRLNQEEAHEYAEKMRADFRIPRAVTIDRNIDMATACQRFLRMSKRIKPATLRYYEQNCRIHIAPAFPMRVRDVSDQHVVAFLTELLNGGMAEGTAFGVLGVLRQVCAQMKYDGVISQNPTADVWRRLPVSHRERRRNKKERREDVLAFSFREKDQFIDAVMRSPYPPRLRAYWVTMAYTGMRPGECSALRPSDVHLTTGTLRIERNLAPEAYGSIEKRLGSTKTDVARDFDMGVDLMKFLADYLDSGLPNEQWLFPTETGGPLPRHLVNNSFDALVVAAGIPPTGRKRFTPKTLRHSYASHMLMKGAPFLWVAKQIGDTPDTMLKRYSWAVPDEGSKWANTLDTGLPIAVRPDVSSDVAATNGHQPKHGIGANKAELNQNETSRSSVVASHRPKSYEEFLDKPANRRAAPPAPKEKQRRSAVGRHHSPPKLRAPKKPSRRRSA